MTAHFDIIDNDEQPTRGAATVTVTALPNLAFAASNIASASASVAKAVLAIFPVSPDSHE